MTPIQARGVAALALVLCAWGGYGLYRRGQQVERSVTITGDLPAPVSDRGLVVPDAGERTTEVVVHVVGAVRRSGVYHLPQRSRVEDAVAAAGGATPTADKDAINLAAFAQDGEQIVVPAKGIASAQPAASAPPLGSPRSTRSPTAGAFQHPAKKVPKVVSLNSATVPDLESLPGIGPSMSERIIKYRKEIGRFTAVEQLMDVPGIGEKKLAKMKPYLRL